MEVIVHCGKPVVNDERLMFPLETGKRCAAPVAHPGSCTDDYWEWIYEARKRVIDEWDRMMQARRVPNRLRARLLELVRGHYLEVNKAAQEPQYGPMWQAAAQQSPQDMNDALRRIMRDLGMNPDDYIRD